MEETCLDDFWEFVAGHPSAVALLHQGDGGSSSRFPYRHLACAAAAVQQGLRDVGLCRGDTIVSFCDEAPALVIAFLGIASACGVVVPLDPAMPQARLRSVIIDCGALLALCGCEWKEALAAKVYDAQDELVRLVTLEAMLGADGSGEACLDLAPIASRPQPADHLHLIYTSGSTGRPKAVLVTHGAMHAYSRAKRSAHRLEPGGAGVGEAGSSASRVLLASAHTWDPCIGDTLSTLAAGATLCTAPRAQLLQALGGTMQALQVTHVCATPSLWSLLTMAPSRLPSLQFVALGGEALPFASILPWLAHDTACGDCRPPPLIANTYGVTEVTVYQTIGVCAQGALRGSAGAGWPLRGVELALDHAKGGEILLGGPQIAVGYHGRPELTAERFVWIACDDGAQEAASEEGGLMLLSECGRESAVGVKRDGHRRDHHRLWFRTGDLGVWEEESGLRVLGRLDAQIKLRGIRIELGEVEAVARQSSVITAAAAAVIDDQLILYVVPAADELSPANFHNGGGDVAVRLQLRAWLPPSLQPSRIVAISSLPLTPGGKLLRSELPALQPPPSSPSPLSQAESTEALRGPTELAVAKAWAETLPPGTRPILPHSNFWELGGTSLIAVKMLDRLRGALDASSAGGTDAFERGNQRFATRLCGLYRKPRLRDYCVWLEWAAMPAPSASSHTAADALRSFARVGEWDDGGTTPPSTAGALTTNSGGALLAAGDLALPESVELAQAATAALASAAQLGGRRLVSELLAAHADPEVGTSRAMRQTTPLMYAASRLDTSAANGAEVVATLLAAGAKVNAATRTHATALHRAAGGGCAASLAMLLRCDDCAPNARDLNKWSALFHAAWVGSAECVKLLLAHRVPVDALDRWRRTPLCWASAAGHLDVARCLLGAGANACGPRKPQAAHLERFSQLEWSTPLHLALHDWNSRNTDVTDDADGCCVDASQLSSTAFVHDYAAGVGKGLELVRLLLDAMADPLALDQNGRTAHEIVRDGGAKDAQSVIALLDAYSTGQGAHDSSQILLQEHTEQRQSEERDRASQLPKTAYATRSRLDSVVRDWHWPPGSIADRDAPSASIWEWPPLSV